MSMKSGNENKMNSKSIKLKSLNLDNEEMNKELKNCLSIIIDSEKIKYKMKMPLNSGNLDEYYLLNYIWFRKYLELNNINDEVCEHLVNSVKNNINISNINKQNENEMLIRKIIPQINPNIKLKIKKDLENYYKLKDNELFNLDSSSFTIKGNNILKYYLNFIIISPKTMDSLKKDFPFDYGKYLILLGDNKAFIKGRTQIFIEICFINNKNIFIPELFFYFDKESILNNNLNLLQIDGYEQYIQLHLLFNNDFTSPIFDKNNDNIGYAFRYDPSIKDYSIYQINDQLLAMIKLYFSHTQIKSKLNSNKFLIEKCIILNLEYIHKIKEFFDYNNLEKELNNNLITRQTMNLLKKNNNIENNALNDKWMTLIIKKLPEEININYNKKLFNNKIIGCQEIPDLIPFNNDSNDNLLYYKNFEIFDKSIYDLLLGLNIINYSLYEEKEIYLECVFIEKYILINISKNNRKYTLEVCVINDKNNISPLYLLEYDKRDNFEKHINYVKNIFGIENFFESLDFSYNNRIQMYDENDQNIGIICNLGKNSKKNTILLPINNQNPNNLSNECIQIQSIIEYFPFPPKIGLQNVGTTSIMNAILQCFCNILHFIDFFKFNSKVEETINKYLIEKNLCLTSSFKILIDNLWPYDIKILSNYCGKNTNNRYFIPKKFTNKISKMNDLFKDSAENDAKDFLNFIIMKLHQELNEISKESSNKHINAIKNQSNKNEVLQYFLNNFKKENSIISKEFYAVNCTLFKCSKCQNIKYDYQSYFFLNFSLEEIRKYKIDESSNQLMNMYQNKFNDNPYLFQQYLEKMKNFNSVTLEDCFKYFEIINCLEGENAIYCNICQNILPFLYRTKLFTGPEILIILLNRENAIESNIKLEFDLFIDLTNYFEQKENNGWKYELIGVVSKLGESNSSWKFIAYCKSPIDGQWYQYNYELVYEIKDFKKEVRDFAIPYILFYQKVK